MNTAQNSRRKTKPRITRHTLDVTHPLGRRLSNEECHSITELPGINTLTCDIDRGHLEITYDLNRLHLDNIEHHLLKLGYIRKRDLFHKIRNDLAHFFEKNEMRA
jgi:hypothetical protein